MESRGLPAYTSLRRIKRIQMMPLPREPLMIAVCDPLEDVLLMRPVVRLVGDRIEWSSNEKWEVTAYTDDLLFEFAALAYEVDPKRFLSFADQYGVLMVRPDGPYWRSCLYDHAPLPPEVEGAPGWFWESIETWRSVASYFRTILMLFSYLKQGMLVPDEDWMASVTLLQSDDEPLRRQYLNATAEAYLRAYEKEKDFSLRYLYYQQKIHAGDHLERLFYDANLRPVLQWTYSTDVMVTIAPAVDLQIAEQPIKRGPSLFALLTLQLVALITSPLAHLHRCSRCNGVYQTERKARTDQPHYCSQCRVAVRRETIRESARKHRAARTRG